MTEAAIKAAYHDYKRVLGRKVLQIVLEVPLEQEGDVHAKIGYPSPDGSTWVAIARLAPLAAAMADQKPSAYDKPKRSWDEMPRSQQAGIACEDSRFRHFLIERRRDPRLKGLDPDTAAGEVRHWCGIASRSQLDTSPLAAEYWDKLYSDYQLWKRGAAA